MVTQVIDQVPRVQFTATGGQTIFAYNFQIFVKTDITVEQNGTPLAVDVDFTVSGVGNINGGNVTLTVGATVGDIMTIFRSQNFDRETDYQESGDFLSEEVNNDFNRMILMLQQNREELSRSLQYPVDDILSSNLLPIKSLRTGQFLGFDSSGDPVALASPGTQLLPSGTIRTFVNLSTESAALSHAGVSTGFAIESNFYDLNLADGSRALHTFTGTTTPTKSGNWPDDDGQFYDADGKQFSLQGVANVLAFGVIPDGDGVGGGTDNTPATQIAVNAVLRGINGKVRLAAGISFMGSTLHAGWGEAFIGLVIEGAGQNYRGVSSGTTLLDFSSFSDAPGINVQGARYTVLRDFGIIGANGAYIVAQDLGTNTTLKDDLVGANWVDPVLSANADSQFAPYAGISVDAYSGVEPATSYPTVTYPDYTGIGSTQYGKNFSSNVRLENVYIGGFVVDVVVQPCDANGNGDFVTLENCSLERARYLMSVGNSQSRNVGLANTQLFTAFEAFTNKAHGKQIGKFGGHIDNCSLNHVIHIFNLKAFEAEPINITSMYAENIWRLGDFGGDTTADRSFHFDTCEFNFNLQTVTRGFPAKAAEAGAQWLNLEFTACYFRDYESVVTFTAGRSSFDGCYFRKDTRAKLYEKFAHNVLCGGLIVGLFGIRADRNRLKLLAFDLDSGTRDTVAVGTEFYQKSDQSFCIPLYTETIGRAADRDTDFLYPPVISSTPLNKSTEFSSLTLSDRVLTGTFNSRTEQKYAYFGPLPGDVIVDDTTQSIFFVRSRTGTTFIAELQNNYKDDGAGGFETLDAFSTTAGNLYVIVSRYYMPPEFLRVTMAAASAVFTSCSNDEGTSTYDAEIAVNDWIFVSPKVDQFVSTPNSQITARDQAAKTITVTGTGAINNETDKRLTYFTRQPPANEASR